MPARRTRSVMIVAGAALVGLFIALPGCGQAPAQVSSPITQDLTTPTSPAPSHVPSTTVLTSSGTASTEASDSFSKIWQASVGAVEALGPTRIKVIKTSESQGQSGSTAENIGPQITEVEELLDPAGGRARLTITRPNGSRETIAVDGRERTTLCDPFHTGTPGRLLSYSRYVSLEAPAGLALPVWAGTSALEDNPEVFDYTRLAAEATCNLAVEQLKEGGHRLQWDYSAGFAASSWELVLDHDFLPVRIEMRVQSTNDGVTVKQSVSLEYHFEKPVSFSASDFMIERPEKYWRQGITYELSTEFPWSDRADWGQYWLGKQVNGWVLDFAEQTDWEESPDLGPNREPGDEVIYLIYDQPDALPDNLNIQVAVRALRGRIFEDSRNAAEQGVASGDFFRREMTVAGVPATVYFKTVGGDAKQVHSVTFFLPDAMVDVQLWEPMDPQFVLDALTRVK